MRRWHAFLRACSLRNQPTNVFSDAIGNQRGLRKAFLLLKKKTALCRFGFRQPQLLRRIGIAFLLGNRRLRRWAPARRWDDDDSGEEAAHRLFGIFARAPQPPSCVRNLMPSTFGKPRRCDPGCFHERSRCDAISGPSDKGPEKIAKIVVN